MRPTQAIEIFGNVSSSTPFGTLAICDLSAKILRRSFQGKPSVGGLNARGVAEYSDFGHFESYISETMQGPKLLVITNRKSNMSFRLVPNWVTLNDLERRNNGVKAVTMRYFTEFGSFQVHYVKVVFDTPNTFCSRNVAQII